MLHADLLNRVLRFYLADIHKTNQLSSIKKECKKKKPLLHIKAHKT